MQTALEISTIKHSLSMSKELAGMGDIVQPFALWAGAELRVVALVAGIQRFEARPACEF